MPNDRGSDDATIIQESSTPAGPSPRARLVCLDDLFDDSLKDLEIPLTEGEQSIGRGAQNSICLVYKKISRRHARVYPSDGSWEIEDLQSANGVFVNEERVTRSRLGHGDIVRLGPVPFRFELERPESLQPTQTPSSAHLGDGGTMYAYHAGVLESLVAADEAPAAENADTRAPPGNAPKARKHPDGAETFDIRQRVIRYGFMLLLGLVVFGGGYAYLQHRSAQEGETIANGLAARFQQFLDHHEGSSGGVSSPQVGQRELTEIRDLVAEINYATRNYPHNASLRALQARVSFIDFEREFAALLGDDPYQAERLANETKQSISSLPPGKGSAGQEAILEVTNLLDLAEILARFKQFRQRFPDPSNPEAMQPNPYELQAVDALKAPLIEKKKLGHVALSITYSRFQRLLAEVEEEDIRLINRWQQVIGRR
ncbi:MAG: FHA domain-containing protein [Gammaproteobacteria bacterium]